MRAIPGVIFIFGVFFTYGETAVITVPLPVSVTVPPFTTATFTCEGTGDIFNWLVQSAVLTDLVKQQRQITVTTTNTNNTNFSSVLTVNAIRVNDDLGIGCEVITLNPFNRVISKCNLTIRGVSPVEDLQYNFTSNTTLLITWSPPVYYSNDVPIGSPVSYQVLVTDEEDGDIILDTNTPHTNIEVANITECDTFNVSITAIYAQYTSNTSTNSNNGNYSITEYHTQPLIPSISFELGCPPSKCILSLMDGNTEVTDIIDETEQTIEFKLSPFRHYELTAVVKNLRDKTRATYSTSIFTFHTQDIIISSPYTNGSVSVQCVFVSGSTADGCHVIFTDTSNGTVFNISLVQEPTLVTLPAGNYTVTAYDNISGSIYGPAVCYPTPVEIIKVIPPTSTSSIIMSESTTAPPQSTHDTVSPTVTVTVGTETTSSTSGTIKDTTNYIIPVVAGTVSGIVLMILIILALSVGITVNRKKRMKGRVFVRSEIATCQQPQAETNQYQDVHELINEVPINTSSVQLTHDRPIDEENPYHVTRSEFLRDNQASIPSHNAEGLMQQEQRPSITSTTTQETTLEDSISSTTLNNIHDNAYTIEPAVTVNVNNDTVSMTATNTASATANPTYAVIAKRTDDTDIPNVDQRVVYDKVTGDINKRGDVNLYHENRTSSFVIGDEVAADLSDSPPPSYDDSDTNVNDDPIIEPSAWSNYTGSSQASPVDHTYPQAEKVSQMNGATSLCVTSPAKQPMDGNKHSSSRQSKHPIDPNTGSTPLLALFSHATQEDDGLLLFDDDNDLTTMTPENINNDMLIVSRGTSQLSNKEEEINIEVFASSFDDEKKEESALTKCEENSEVIQEEDNNTLKATCQSALQILLKYVILTTFLLRLLFVTVIGAALVSSQCSGVYKTSDGNNHTEMVSVHYNLIEMEEEEGSVASQPLNATEYLLRLYIDGFYSSEVNINITTIGNMKKLLYVTPVLNMFHDGTTYDVCLPTVYLRGKGELLTSIGRDHRWVIRNCFKPLEFDTRARLLKMCMYRSYNTCIYGEDDHNGNSNETINCRRLEWWIYMITAIFIISGIIQCVTFLIMVNTVWMKKLKKFFRNKNRLHLPELVESLIRFVYHDTSCFTIITKMILQNTISFQKENWKILEGSCPTTPAVIPTDQYGTDARCY